MLLQLLSFLSIDGIMITRYFQNYCCFEPILQPVQRDMPELLRHISVIAINLILVLRGMHQPTGFLRDTIVCIDTMVHDDGRR